MTVIVGVLCEDGVVVGSDSSATFTAGASPTIEQPADKVFVIGNEAIFAGSGHVGCIQRFKAFLEGIQAAPGFRKRKGLDTAKGISTGIINDLASTHCPKNVLGAVVAFPSLEGFQLCEFDIQHLQPELKTPKMWFVTMGSGQSITDPFLGMIRRVFFRNSRPKLNEGIFAVTWSLQQAIELNAGGINGPIQIGVLTQKSGSGVAVARLLDEAELQEHQNNVNGIEEHLADYRSKLSGQGAQEIPQPP